MIGESVEVTSHANVRVWSWSGAATDTTTWEIGAAPIAAPRIERSAGRRCQRGCFVDSSFLRNVLVADRRAKEKDRVFRLQMDTAPIVRRAFEVSGVLERLTVVHNRDDALA